MVRFKKLFESSSRDAMPFLVEMDTVSVEQQPSLAIKYWIKIEQWDIVFFAQFGEF